LNILRCIKVAMVASIALFFSVIALDNFFDFESNWIFVKHVFSMDTTFHDPVLMSRAITNSVIQKYAYYFIMSWEALTAVLCWIGSVILLFNVNQSNLIFNQSKRIAFLGLFLGFLLYMIGFIIIGGEWFSMWQSSMWNGQMKAGLFLSIIMFVMIFLQCEIS